MTKEQVAKFIIQEDEKIKQLNKLVIDAINNNEIITKKLMQPWWDNLTRGQKIADKVASFGWSWKFIISFGTVLFFWILLNAYFLANKWFDPYPFILLNLILSCIAAIQAPVIMMSQNRKEEIDRWRSENDYIINLKAETQIRNINEKVDILLIEQMEKMFKLQESQLKLLKEIKTTLIKK